MVLFLWEASLTQMLRWELRDVRHLPARLLAEARLSEKTTVPRMAVWERSGLAVAVL